MKTVQVFLVMLLVVTTVNAQKPNPTRSGLPITLSLFSESISLPTFKHIQTGGIGIKIGTELYYRNRPGSQLIQTLNVGYYHHPRVQTGFFVNSEFGFRKYVGSLYVDAFLGGGTLLVRPVSPSYTQDSNSGEYRKAPATQLKFMPTISAGLGYRFHHRTTVFTRYELFGEMPFREILLPHQALHLGTRFLFN
ncbi:hypothetical protein [Larkinella sp. C7]|jgi:hypothetical protein|uniref:hypothetical protein n=1 Tax=Larkinella sp. C7 TaxID=2576607 RepID=UPI001111283E|nr:hypothetical protein [Larkinella sp. C7]